MAAACGFPTRRQRLPSLSVHLPSPRSTAYHMPLAAFPSSPLDAVASPTYVAHPFPREVSPIHHQRLPPLHALVRSSPKAYDHHHHRRDAMMPLPRRDFLASPPQAATPRFTFPTLPSLKDTLHLSPVVVDSPSKTSSSTGVKLCGVSGCEKRAKAGGVCIAHGGGIRCSKEGCSKHAVSLGYCISHGGGKRCTAEGCQNASRKFGVCWSHGGKRMCLVQGCTKGPKTGGYCWAHGGKVVATAVPKK